MRDDDDSSAPSLLLAQELHRAHREQIHYHHHHHHQKHDQGRLHHRQDATAIASASVVTEVIQTISLVQQIDVDSNGNTFSILTVLADATSNAPQAILTDSAPATTADATILSSTYSASQTLPTAVDSAAGSSSSSPSATIASTSTPSQSQSSFASFLVSSNSTTLISSSNSLSNTFHPTNSTSSLSSSKSSLTHLKSSSSVSSSFTSSEVSSITLTSSSNSFASTSFQSASATSTGSAGVVAGGTGVTPGTATSSAASSGNGTDSNSGSSVSTSAVVGGVVGGIAGVAVIALLLLFIVKWRKNRSGALLSLGSGRDGAGDGADAVAGGQPSQPSGGMAERRSFVYAVPTALASLTGYKRSSQRTETTANSERGFVRVSGRKLPSVLQTGGDGYGDGLPDNTLSGSSFYRDSHGFYGGPGTPTFPTRDMQRESGQIGTPVMRPSPARTPVTEQGPFSTVPPPLDPLPPQRPDGLGRSHPSQDGSHASRFTEEV